MLNNYLANAVIALTALMSHQLYAATCEFIVSNEWNSGFTSSIAITNDTNQVIDGWAVAIDFAGDAKITGMWNADHNDQIFPDQATDAGYNGQILPGGKIQFGFNSQKSVPGSPASIPALGGICADDDSDSDTPPPQAEPSPEPAGAAAQCDYILRNQWRNGFTAAVKIRNVGKQPIEGWAVSLAFPAGVQITNHWNAARDPIKSDQLVNLGWNANIQPGGAVEFGLQGSKSSPGLDVTPVLGGICGDDAPPSNQPPVAQVTASPRQGTAPLAVNFNGSGSADPDGDNLSYLWNFGDGNTANTATAVHTYTAAGTYAVSLTVTDTAGDSDVARLTITVTTQKPVQPTAAYRLDAARSSLYFVSTKKVHVVETHTFGTLSGDITADGAAAVRIDLDSVDTGIDIRDERMRNFLFETATFQSADITLDVALADVSDLPVGQSLQRMITPTLDLHGFSVPLSASVLITKLADDTLLVQNVSPVIVKAADFGLVDGIEILRDLAKLSVISYSVPVNFTLIFKQQ
ncbi:MAG: cellulose binding domain-containing protein [Pseudomonadota bacterium]